MVMSFISLMRVWSRDGVTDDNRLSTSWQELWVYPIPAALYLVKNLMQYVIFLYVDAPSYQARPRAHSDPPSRYVCALVPPHVPSHSCLLRALLFATLSFCRRKASRKKTKTRTFRLADHFRNLRDPIQILKNLNIISTGVLYRIFLKKPLSGVQWSALMLLALGCTIAQLTSGSDQARERTIAHPYNSAQSPAQ